MNENLDKSMKIEEIYKLFVGNRNASDLHIRTDMEPVMRVNGDLKPLGEFGKLDLNFIKFMIGSMFKDKYTTEAKKMYEEFVLKGKEMDFAIDIPGSDYRARVNLFKSLGNIGIVMRKIPNDMPKLDSLGIMEEHLRLIRQYLSYKEGLILITGQTGSGKSTTLAAIINEINEKYGKHIITIEDPVEFKHNKKKSMITHREVGETSDTNDFTKGIRAAVREDPDIILVGEMRDAETATAALQAAQTGHLVFATLHTNSAPETLVRLLDMFPSEKADSVRVSLGESIRLVMSQKLAPTIEGKRTLCYEFLYSNNNIKNAIITDKKSYVNTIKEQMNTKFREGMLTMNRCLYERYKDGLISTDTAYEFSADRAELKDLIED